MENSSRPRRTFLWLLILWIILGLATLALAWTRTGEVGSAAASPISGIVATIQENDPTVWKYFGLLFGCELLGVLASFYLIRAAFKPNFRTLILAIIIALLNFGTLYSQYQNKSVFAPLDYAAFFKDGFFWFASLPLLARLLGVSVSTQETQENSL